MWSTISRAQSLKWLANIILNICIIIITSHNKSMKRHIEHNVSATFEIREKALHVWNFKLYRVNTKNRLIFGKKISAKVGTNRETTVEATFPLFHLNAFDELYLTLIFHQSIFPSIHTHTHTQPTMNSHSETRAERHRARDGLTLKAVDEQPEISPRSTDTPTDTDWHWPTQMPPSGQAAHKSLG